MGYTLYQPAPSPGRLPVDAPRRYGRGAPARPTSLAARLWAAGPGAAAGTRCRLCGRGVLFCLVSVSRALPGPGGAVVSPARRSSPPRARETAGLRASSFPTRAAHTPGAARCCLAGGRVCRARGPGSLSGQQGGSREAPRGWDSQERPVLVQRRGQGLCPQGLEDVGWKSAVGAQHQGWVPWWEKGLRRDGGKAKRIFCCALGVWAELCGVRETCNGPGTRAPCHLGTSRLSRPLAPEVPGFVCSNESPGTVSSRCGAVPPAPDPVPRCSSLLAGEGSICRGCVPLRHGARHAGASRPLRPPPKSKRSLSGKELSLEGKGGKSCKRWPSACYPDKGSGPAPGPGGPEYSLRPRELRGRRRGAWELARQCPPSPGDSAGMEVSLLQSLCFSPSAPHCGIRCKSRIPRSLPLPTPERYGGSRGAVPNLCVSGRETGFRCLSRSRAASFSSTGSLGRALLESFSQSLGRQA